MRISRVVFLSCFIGLCAGEAGARANPAAPLLQVPAPGEVSYFFQTPGPQSLNRSAGAAMSYALQMGQKTQTCFTMRSYRFARDPDSDTMRPAGSSTCVEAGQFRMKGAAVLPAVAHP